MIVGIGIDIVEISRVEAALARGERFRERTFTAGEADFCEARAGRVESYAARFAAKEAAMKALGTGWAEGVGWKEIEVVVSEDGAPALRFTGAALARMQALGARRAHLSLSHAAGVAVAQVVLED